MSTSSTSTGPASAREDLRRHVVAHVPARQEPTSGTRENVRAGTASRRRLHRAGPTPLLGAARPSAHRGQADLDAQFVEQTAADERVARRRDVEAKFRATGSIAVRILTALTDKVLPTTLAARSSGDTRRSAHRPALAEAPSVPTDCREAASEQVTLAQADRVIEHRPWRPDRLQDLLTSPESPLAGPPLEGPRVSPHRFVLRRRIEASTGDAASIGQDRGLEVALVAVLEPSHFWPRFGCSRPSPSQVTGRSFVTESSPSSGRTVHPCAPGTERGPWRGALRKEMLMGPDLIDACGQSVQLPLPQLLVPPRDNDRAIVKSSGWLEHFVLIVTPALMLRLTQEIVLLPESSTGWRPRAGCRTSGDRRGDGPVRETNDGRVDAGASALGLECDAELIRQFRGEGPSSPG